MIVKDAIGFRNTSARSSPRRRRTRRSRSHARWAGRAAARSQSKLRCGGGDRATFGSGGARKYGCDQTGCGGLSVVEQAASLIGALNSPHDKSADERQSLETKPISRGTESSNPVPSSGESIANLPSVTRCFGPEVCTTPQFSPPTRAVGPRFPVPAMRLAQRCLHPLPRTRGQLFDGAPPVALASCSSAPPSSASTPMQKTVRHARNHSDSCSLSSSPNGHLKISADRVRFMPRRSEDLSKGSVAARDFPVPSRHQRRGRLGASFSLKGSRVLRENPMRRLKNLG